MTDRTRDRGRILVVDDEEMNRELLRQELEDRGFEVHLASSGEECLALARVVEPECIVLDVQMPRMDGIETCRRLKQDPEASHIPVLYVTAYHSEKKIVRALEAGGNDFLSKPYSPSILTARVDCQLSIFRTQEKLRQLAMTDELTGVYSRRFLFQELRRVVQSAARGKVERLACLMVDVDHFKPVNDTRGHRAGDRFLRRVAQTVQRSIRDVDTLARFGGDEFTVILPDTTLAEAAEIGERIRASVEAECDPCTVSVGGAEIDFSDIEALGEDEAADDIVDNLVTRADRALYRAKEQGRNRVVT